MFGVGQGADGAGTLAPWITRLLVDCDGVVRLRIHAVFVQPLQEGVAFCGVLDLDNVQVPHVAVARLLVRQVEGLGTLKALGVVLGQFDAVVVPLVDVFEFGAQDAGLDVVQTAVEAEAVHVAGGRAVGAEQLGHAVDLFVVGDNRTAIAEAAQVFLDDETGSHGIGELADLEGIARRVNGLGVIFDDPELVLVGDLFDRRHVSALPVQMDRHNALRLAGDGCLDLGGVDALGLGIAVNHDYGRAGDPDGFRRGEEGVGVGDDFVAFANAQGHQGQPEGVRAVTAGDGVFRAGKIGEFLLKLLVHGAVDILATLNDRFDIGINF